ncbi:MAG: cysteine--tRNA ligase [Phycisphaerae bacterium]|nr:cysteine--tRNA ligase [Phycisphaerae bacterium]
MPLRLYNTLSKRPEDFVPADPSRVTFYTCGLTVYDYGHIGNFRSFLAADLLRRWIESPLCEVSDGRGGVHRGPRRVVHVMNVTDVGHMTDDAEGGEAGEDRMAVAGKRLLEAKKSGKLPPGTEIDPRDPYAIAKFYTDRFIEDATALGLKVVLDAKQDPTLMPRATDNVQGMIRVIERLIARGFAYAVSTPGGRVVYFRVKRFGPYGRLSGNTLDALKEGEGGRVSGANQEQKEHPADFLLWKEDPTHIMKWDSPWGAGYPGWHIECTVMSARRLLGEGEFQRLLGTPDAGPAIIDLHSGGEDNIFPHHECEIAQTCGAFCAVPDSGTFSRAWFHPRFLLVEGTKMSKSKGNFFTAADLFAKGIEPAALRLELIKTHYRSNANFTMQGLGDNARILERWRRVLAGGGTGGDAPARARCAVEFAAAMNDDLNIAAAIAAVNTWAASVASPGAEDAALMRTLDGVLGVLDLARPKATQTDIGLFAPGTTPDPAVEALLRERREARAAKDFKKSDAIRDQLAGMGYAIKDVAGGKVEVRRV